MYSISHMEMEKNYGKIILKSNEGHHKGSEWGDCGTFLMRETLLGPLYMACC